MLAIAHERWRIGDEDVCGGEGRIHVRIDEGRTMPLGTPITSSEAQYQLEVPSIVRVTDRAVLDQQRAAPQELDSLRILGEYSVSREPRVANGQGLDGLTGRS